MRTSDTQLLGSWHPRFDQQDTRAPRTQDECVVYVCLCLHTSSLWAVEL